MEKEETTPEKASVVLVTGVTFGLVNYKEQAISINDLVMLSSWAAGIKRLRINANCIRRLKTLNTSLTNSTGGEGGFKG